jgi:hypothetical protein
VVDRRADEIAGKKAEKIGELTPSLERHCHDALYAKDMALLGSLIHPHFTNIR